MRDPLITPGEKSKPARFKGRDAAPKILCTGSLKSLTEIFDPVRIRQINSLRGSDRNILVLFCNCKKPKLMRGLQVIPLQLVYDAFVATPTGKLWLNVLGTSVRNPVDLNAAVNFFAAFAVGQPSAKLANNASQNPIPLWKR